MKERYLKDLPVIAGLPTAVALVLWIGGKLIHFIFPRVRQGRATALAGGLITLAVIIRLSWEAGPPEAEIQSRTRPIGNIRRR